MWCVISIEGVGWREEMRVLVDAQSSNVERCVGMIDNLLGVIVYHHSNRPELVVAPAVHVAHSSQQENSQSALPPTTS